MSEILTQSEMIIPCVTNDGDGPSFFSEKAVTLNGDEQRMRSEQITAVNFRLRESFESYESGWHVAGDPTLLIILSGCMQIELRNGLSKEFKSGEMFIAEDYLAKGAAFNEVNGHRARVLGDQKIQVLHLKLSKIRD